MHLPRLSGLETMAIVRQIKGMLPMILVSADQDETLLRRALSAQAFSVLAKPLSKGMVIHIVRRALEKFY
jgi:CheY-like chemotaxis protein